MHLSCVRGNRLRGAIILAMYLRPFDLITHQAGLETGTPKASAGGDRGALGAFGWLGENSVYTYMAF